MDAQGTTAYTIIGLALLLMGSASLYLASPNQRWLDHAWRPRRAALAGLSLLSAGLAALLQSSHPLAAVFTAFTWVMFLLVAFPYLGAWRSLRKSH